MVVSINFETESGFGEDPTPTASTENPEAQTPVAIIPKLTKKQLMDIISLKRFDEEIPDEAAALAFFEEERWGGTPYCGHCGSENVYRVKSGKPMSHRCRICKKYFSVRIGTPVEKSLLPIRTWLLAIHLVLTSRKGTSHLQLSKMLGVDYRTAWFLGHRIREAMVGDDSQMSGVVQVDETFIGGKSKSMHSSKKPEG